MGNISWMFGVIGLRSVQASFPISACLEAASKTGYLEEDSMAPGNWVVELGRWQLLWTAETLQREGENVFPSSFIKPCETNWNKMLSIPMMWVRSTCHRRCDLSEIWEDCSGAEKEEKGAGGASAREGRACVEGWGRAVRPAGVWTEMRKTEPGVRQAPWFLWPQESLTNRTAFPLVIRC